MVWTPCGHESFREKPETAGGRTDASLSRPIYSFILKIASRCNLNCHYCFVYNAADDNWKRQPKRMSLHVARQTARRIREHADEHGLQSVSVIFHGGEPLLVGTEYLRQLFFEIADEFSGSDTEIRFGMQSNGLLFTPDIGDVLLEFGGSIGISVDGPPHVNDLNRVDLNGTATTRRLECALKLLCSPAYKSLFSGFLCVINVHADPIEIIEYLHRFDPPGIDFILPYNNHDRYPPGKHSFTSVEYGQWLIRLFDHWFDTLPHLRVRLFDSLLRIFLGGTSLVESLGVAPVDLIVIESDGAVEAVDSLKATFNGATVLGMGVFDQSFSEVLHHAAVAARQSGVNALCSTCQKCEVVQFCGGGYLPNRYSHGNAFNNPSVYCRDLELLIRHIGSRIRPHLEQAQLLHRR